jgi:hypothetical protein
MTHDERLVIFKRDLAALVKQSNALVIFNLAHDEDSFAQYSHADASEPLLCEVSNRSEGWNSNSLDVKQVAALRALGYEIPSPHHQSNPHKNFAGDTDALAEEVDQIFGQVYRAPQDYDIVSSGVMNA